MINLDASRAWQQLYVYGVEGEDSWLQGRHPGGRRRAGREARHRRALQVQPPVSEHHGYKLAGDHVPFAGYGIPAAGFISGVDDLVIERGVFWPMNTRQDTMATLERKNPGAVAARAARRRPRPRDGPHQRTGTPREARHRRAAQRRQDDPLQRADPRGAAATAYAYTSAESNLGVVRRARRTPRPPARGAGDAQEGQRDHRRRRHRRPGGGRQPGRGPGQPLPRRHPRRRRSRARGPHVLEPGRGARARGRRPAGRRRTGRDRARARGPGPGRAPPREDPEGGARRRQGRRSASS